MKRTCTVGWYLEHPREFELVVAEWNDRELARHERETDVDEDYEAWLEEIEPEDA